MTTFSWAASPDALGLFDAKVVRCIAGEATTDTLKWAAGEAGIDLPERMDVLMDKHYSTSANALSTMTVAERRRIANAILQSELDVRESMPAALVPLRPLRRA